MRLIAKVGIIIGIIITIIVVAGVVLFHTAISMIAEQMGIVLPDDLEQMVLKDVNHADLVRDNSAYIGEMVKGTGQIIDIVEMHLGNTIPVIIHAPESTEVSHIYERPLDEFAYVVDTGDGQYYLLRSHRTSDAETHYALFYGTVAGLQKLNLASGDTVSAVVLDQRYIAFSTTPDPFSPAPDPFN